MWHSFACPQLSHKGMVYALGYLGKVGWLFWCCCIYLLSDFYMPHTIGTENRWETARDIKALLSLTIPAQLPSASPLLLFQDAISALQTHQSLPQPCHSRSDLQFSTAPQGKSLWRRDMTIHTGISSRHRKAVLTLWQYGHSVRGGKIKSGLHRLLRSCLRTAGDRLRYKQGKISIWGRKLNQSNVTYNTRNSQLEAQNKYLESKLQHHIIAKALQRWQQLFQTDKIGPVKFMTAMYEIVWDKYVLLSWPQSPTPSTLCDTQAPIP